jgi:hypothetical protein
MKAKLKREKDFNRARKEAQEKFADPLERKDLDNFFKPSFKKP